MATCAALSVADKALCATTENENFLRLTRLLMRGGVTLLLEVFDSIHPPAKLPSTLSNCHIKEKLQDLRAKKVLSQPEWDRLYLPTGMCGKSADFDISLLFKLLRNICNLIPPTTGWDNLPNNTDHCLQADLARIKCYRNSIYSHDHSMEIIDADFANLWTEISDALLRIANGLSSAKKDEWENAIGKLRHDPLTPDAQQNVAELRAWYKKDMDTKEEVEKLRIEVQQMHLNQQEQRDMQQEQRDMLNIVNVMLQKVITKQDQTAGVLIKIQTAVESIGGPSHVPTETQLQEAYPQPESVYIPMPSEQPQAGATAGPSTSWELQANQQSFQRDLDIWRVILSFKSSFTLLIEYLRIKLGVDIQDSSLGSLVLTASCSSLQVLEGLWEDYCSGHLSEVVQETLVTAEVLKELNLSEVKLKTIISEEEFKACKELFAQKLGGVEMESPLPDAAGVPLGYSRMEGVDPLGRVRHLGMLVKKTMQIGDHAEAFRLISMALAQLKSFNCPPHYTAPFLLDRAECLWQLGDVQASLQNMEDAINHGLSNDAFFAEYQDAARLFKKNRLPIEASRFYESQNNYRDAIETLCLTGHIEEALDALERFNIFSSSGDLEGQHGIIPPRSTRTVERLRHQLADQLFKKGNKEGMEEVLNHLPSTDDRITFLKKRGCVIEAARAMESVGRRYEAARLLRDEGMFQEAVKYSSDPKFTADCLVSLARTTSVTEDTTQFLQTALMKYQQCHDIIGQAEALLLLGKLSKEVQKIQEAGKMFDKCKSCCGEVESVAELLKITHYSPPENFSQWVPVRALDRVLRLVTLLYRRGSKLSMMEQKEVEKCEQHFGLFPTDVAHKRVYFCKRGGRYSRVDPEFTEHNASNTEVTIDTTEAHQKIARFLINFSVTLITMIRKMLENTFSRSSLCRKETEGSLCDNSSCEYQHGDTEEFFNSRFHALFNFVYLESVVEQNISEMTTNKNGNDVASLICKDFRAFYACQRFYSLLFPSSGYRKYDFKLAHVRSIRMTKAVKRRILQFASFLWTETPEENRRSNTDNFLKVSTSLELVGSGPLMVRWICEEEKEFQKKTRTSKVTNDQLVKNGMVGLSRQNDSGPYESYLHWWQDGKKRLYVYCDVQTAAHLIIRRFLTLIARRSHVKYLSIANTVMILEHQLTACLALYTRLCKDHQYPICLPGSYLTMIRIWDNFRPGIDKDTRTLYEAIEHNACQETNKERLFKAISSILDYMVKLTCGDIAPLCDVLGDALSSDDTPMYNTSGEAERSLVLFLTMLCNCGKGISTSVEGVMLRKILNLKPNPCLLNRIKNVLVEVQEAKGCCDVVAILNKFLQSRGEVLYDLRWGNGKLWQDGPSNPNRYLQRFHTDTAAITREELNQDERHQLNVKAPKDHNAVKSDDVIAEKEDLDAAVEDREVYSKEELKDKEKLQLEVTVTTMQKLYRKKKLLEKIHLWTIYYKALQERKLSQVSSVEEQTKASTSVSEDHFARFQVDSSACGICGTNFIAPTDDYQLPVSHEDNEDSQESSEQTKVTLPNQGFETAEAHKKSQSHLQKERQFQQYKDFYLAEIHPYLMKDEVVRKMVEDVSCGDKRWVEDFAYDLERLETARSAVKSEVQTIESFLDWTNTSSLMSAAKELGVRLLLLLRETNNTLEQAKTDSLASEHNDEKGTEGRKDEKEDDIPKHRRKRSKR